jgi:soluble lytic murein transglycosylase
MALLSLAFATLTVAANPVAVLGQGYQAFAAGDYRKAAKTLAGLEARLPRNRDYALYLAAESELYAGRPARARSLFGVLANEKDSRFALLAPWRVADCLWAEGRKSEAGAAYKKLLPKPPPGVDPVVAKFHLAELASPEDAPKLFHDIHVEHPTHPLAAEAGQRAGTEPDDEEPEKAPPPLADPKARLRRAALLADKKHYKEAIAELEAMTNLTPDQAIERDFQLGMARFGTRRQYAAAAELLLAVEPKLKGDRAAFAAFHGGRAQARSGREDDAIATNLRIVRDYPGSRWAVEAQFVVGWLEFNRGRYAESVPALQTTLDKHSKSAYGNDAAWFLAMAHHLLGQPDQALAALADYARLSGNDPDAALRASYWRGRFLLAKRDQAEAKSIWRELVEKQPLSYYGLLARARLKALGAKLTFQLPKDQSKPVKVPPKLLKRDPTLLRAEELAQAGLTVEAGLELQRSEDALEQRLGRDQALAVMLERYPRWQAYRRGYQLAEIRAKPALELAPAGPAKLVWEAAYPRAWRELVEKDSKPAKTPPLFVYTIMQKETGFAPHLTSYADARGLLQLLPALGTELAAKLKMRFYPDELYQPEVNVRLGALHLGELVNMFRGQIFLAAGAYNGGIRGMTRWLDQNGRRPLDEFVELVGFRQSREYIKRAVSIYARYQYLYTGKPYELPLKVNAAYRKGKGRATAIPASDPDTD